jgi:hypothetical protein
MISLSHRCAGHQFRRQGYGCGGLAVHDLQEEGNHFGTDSCEALSSRWIADRTTWRRAESSDPPTAGVSAFNHPVMGDQPRPNFTRIEHLDPKVRKSRPYCFHVFGKRFSADSGMSIRIAIDAIFRESEAAPPLLRQFIGWVIYRLSGATPRRLRLVCWCSSGSSTYHPHGS